MGGEFPLTWVGPAWRSNGDERRRRGRRRRPATFRPRAASKPLVSRLTEIAVAEDIVQKARCREEAAQAHIYELLAPAVHGLIRRIVGNRALAEDLFQDTMMTVFERLDSFRGEAPLGAWVRQVAVTRCLMYLRSPWHRARLALDRVDDAYDASSGDPRARPEILRIAIPESWSDQMDLERALATLSPTARAVVWLYDVEGYSHEEIARQFGRTVSFSKSQLARAHARLREWYEPQTEGQPCAPT
jgi:RNA polymerase sigma factor (sigma-70 family)